MFSQSDHIGCGLLRCLGESLSKMQASADLGKPQLWSVQQCTSLKDCNAVIMSRAMQRQQSLQDAVASKARTCAQPAEKNLVSSPV
mmetsp:Transcript_62319/g.115662  ORF Transcript_62319/g.115662 Transcript_62319/m.115662 type:complete len:86 (+) Transcript_62319:132-389(+)